MEMKKRTRVLIAKVGLDGHDRGAKVIARALKDAGMEVIYTGLHQTPDQIVNTAVQEDVDVIGLSILSGTHLSASRKVLEKLKEKQIKDIALVVGGTIVDRDISLLKEMGVYAVFPMESDINEIVSFFSQI
jgi:methylmalonyl-CoA mutase C-terminal domain/subunit